MHGFKLRIDSCQTVTFDMVYFDFVEIVKMNYILFAVDISLISLSFKAENWQDSQKQVIWKQLKLFHLCNHVSFPYIQETLKPQPLMWRCKEEEVFCGNMWNEICLYSMIYTLNEDILIQTHFLFFVDRHNKYEPVIEKFVYRTKN